MAEDIEQQAEEPEKPKPFLTSPTAEQLRPTPREQILFGELWDWQEQSEKSLGALEVDYSLSPGYHV